MKIIKKIGKYTITILIAIFLMIGSLMLVACIPSKPLQENAYQSGKILQKQQPYWKVISQLNPPILLDNYTEALMINSAYSMDRTHPFESAILVRKNYIPGITKKVNPDTSGNLKSAEKYDGYYAQIDELIDTTQGDVDESFEYARYWHGYLIYLRPMLLIMNITQIRVLFTFILAALTAIACYFMYKKLGIWIAIAFFMAMVCVHNVVIGFSLLAMQPFVIMLIASIILLKRFDKIKSFPFFFFMIGMITVFFDLLTTPIITLGIPLLLYLALIGRNKEVDLKTKLKEIVKLSVLWGLGYILTWASKWIITDSFFHRDIIYGSYLQIGIRTIGQSLSLIEGINRNFRYIKLPFLICIIIMSILAMIQIYIKYKKKELFNIKGIIPVFIVASFSLIWYIGIKEHMHQHAFFTYRTFLVLIFGVEMAIIELFQLYRKKLVGGK